MQVKRMRLVLALFGTVGFCAGGSAQRIESMKLLARQTGWAATSHKLYWTTTGGAGWDDITPKTTSSEKIASVFFSDGSRGWVLLSATAKDGVENRFDMATTSDSGHSWSIAPVTIPDLDPSAMTLSDSGCVDFVDPLHGWLNLKLVSGAAFHLGLLLQTTDGGKTWTRASGGSGTGGDILFVSPHKGWVTSGDEIFATRDGARSWQRFSLEAPVQAGPAKNPTYGLPAFVDKERGFLPVTYSGVSGADSALVLFETTDGGSDWHVDRVVPGLKGRSIGQMVPFAIVDSVLVAAEASARTHLKLMLAAPGLKPVASDAEILQPDSGILEISFTDPRSGWALVVDAYNRNTRLLRTSDGGSTWVDVGPVPSPHSPPLYQTRRWASMIWGSLWAESRAAIRTPTWPRPVNKPRGCGAGSAFQPSTLLDPLPTYRARRSLNIGRLTAGTNN